jgi:AbrB family looped-hinge helix DNA binding protein
MKIIKLPKRNMTAVTLSSKFRIIIPKEIREATNLNSGMKIAIIPYINRIELIPLKPMKELKGSLKSIDTTGLREKKDREL